MKFKPVIPCQKCEKVLTGCKERSTCEKFIKYDKLRIEYSNNIIVK